MPNSEDAFERLVALRWPESICSKCQTPLPRVFDYARGRVRCSNCKHDFQLTGGTFAQRKRLDSQEWIWSAEIFSAAREGISVRVFADELQKISAAHNPHCSLFIGVQQFAPKNRSKGLGLNSEFSWSITSCELNPKWQVTQGVAHSILKVFRSALRPLRYRITGRDRLIFEIEAGFGLFKVHPPGAMVSDRENWRMIVVCSIEMSANSLQRIHSVYVKRLNDNLDDTLATAVREAADGATNVYVFEGSRCTGEKRLNYKAFVSERNRAGADLVTLTNRLRHLLHTLPQGSVNGPNADGHIAEFNLRHHYRKSHSSYIADRLLEQILKPLDHTHNVIELLD
jgi:hypothetical protein